MYLKLWANSAGPPRGVEVRAKGEPSSAVWRKVSSAM